MKLTLDIDHSKQLANICGSLDKHLDIISKSLDVELTNKGVDFVITGKSDRLAVQVLQDLITLSKTQTVDVYDVEMSIKNRTHDDLPSKTINIKTRRKFIHVRSANQQHYVKSIQDKDCTFGIGPAGTGKTYLAVARAVEALECSSVVVSYWYVQRLKRVKNLDFYQVICPKKSILTYALFTMHCMRC